VFGVGFAALLLVLGVNVLIAIVVLKAMEAVKELISDLATKLSKAAAAAAIDAAVLAVIAGLIGVLAYCSTGDFLKGHEFGLAKVAAVSSMAIIVCKMALYTNLRVVRNAVWPLLLLFYLVPIAFGAYYVHSECPNGPYLACVMEFNDDLELTTGNQSAPEKPAQPALMAANTSAVSAPIGAISAAPMRVASSSVAGAMDSEASLHDEPAADRPKREHLMLVAGHFLIFVLTLGVMAHPFTLRGWKRLLGTEAG